MSSTVGFNSATQGPSYAPPQPSGQPSVPPKWDTGYGTQSIYSPPSDAELARQRRAAEDRRQASMRPADRTPAAVQRALDAIVAEGATAQARLAARKDVVASMSDGSTYHAPAMLRDALDALELAEIEAAQFARMETGMRESLAVAQADEADYLRDLGERADAAEPVVAAFRKFIAADYPKLAAAIGKGLGTERAAERAVGVLREAADKLPGRVYPAALPRVPAGSTTAAYRVSASLPGTDVRPATL